MPPTILPLSATHIPGTGRGGPGPGCLFFLETNPDGVLRHGYHRNLDTDEAGNQK